MKKMILLLFFSVLAFGQTVFSNGLALGWKIEPWQNTTVKAVATTPEGVALETSVTGAYGRLYMRTFKGLPMPDKRLQCLQLTLLIKNGSGEIFIGLYDPDGNPLGTVPGTAYIPDKTFVSGKWYKIIIPLTDLNSVGKIVRGVVLETTEPRTFYVNYVAFVSLK